MSDVLTGILERLQALERQSVRLRVGTVTDDAPLSIDVGGSGTAVAGVSQVGGDLSVDDVAAVLTSGTDLLALGALRSGGVFVGQLAPSARSASLPGWLVADGASYLRATYAALFAAIGTTYGSADGTHFNVPDLRGRVPVGLDNQGGTDAGRLAAANTLGGSGGEETHLLTIAESGLPAHTHPPGASTAFMNRVNNASGLAGAGATYGEMNAESTATAANTAADAANAHNNMPPFLLVNWLIYSGA